MEFYFLLIKMKIYTFIAIFFVGATSVVPQLVQAAENKVLECTVQDSNGKAFSYDKGQVFTRPMSTISVSSDGESLIYIDERRGEKFTVSRKTGLFDWIIGDSNSRFSRNEPARMSGVCTLKTEKIMF